MRKITKQVVLCSILMLCLTGCSNIESESKIIKDSPEVLEIKNDEQKQVSKTVSVSSDIQDFLRSLTANETEYDYFLNKEVDFPYYSQYSHVESPNNFVSRHQKVFHNINGKNVKADILYNSSDANINHPNVALGVLLYQAIQHKIAHPEVENEISVVSFRLSIIAGVNVVRSSEYFGTMKSMPDEPIDRDGFVRFSYLLTFAAKLGITVNVISQLDGYSNYGTEIPAATYFNSVLSESCVDIPSLAGKTVGDYLDYRLCKWISYDGKSAADMYHLKIGAARYYLDSEGNENEYGVFSSSANLDGVNYNGIAGNAASQSGVVIINHKYIYLCATNMIEFSKDYMAQDDVGKFRYDFAEKIKSQKAAIKSSGYGSIENEMLIYLGTENDKAFRMMFTPFVEGFGGLNEDDQYFYYLDKVYNSTKAVELYWRGNKYLTNYEYIRIIKDKMVKALRKDKGELENLKSKVFIKIGNIDTSLFDTVELGKHVGSKIVSSLDDMHEKDMFMKYEDEGRMNATFLHATMNNHQGAYWSQLNSLIVIHEDGTEGTDFVDALIASL